LSDEKGRDEYEDDDRRFMDADDERRSWAIAFAFAVEVIERALHSADANRRRQATAELDRLRGAI
jgi:hypothetical protein